jgi:hypothetical protein
MPKPVAIDVRMLGLREGIVDARAHPNVAIVRIRRNAQPGTRAPWWWPREIQTNGPSKLEVVANGIASAPLSVTVTR